MKQQIEFLEQIDKKLTEVKLLNDQLQYDQIKLFGTYEERLLLRALDMNIDILGHGMKNRKLIKELKQPVEEYE